MIVVFGRPFFPKRGMPFAWAGAGAITGGAILINSDGVDFTLLEPHLLAIVFFVTIPAVGAGLIAWLTEVYPRFWRWRDSVVTHGMLHRHVDTVFGWRLHVGPDANPRALANMPMQGNGAEMMRLAACTATEAGLKVCCPVHDAFLVEGETGHIEQVTTAMREHMAAASRVVLAGFELRTGVEVVRYPDRFVDGRGWVMWERVMRLLAEITDPEVTL